MKVRVAFWGGLGGQSPSLGNVRGFRHFADEVEYLPCEKVQARHINQGADIFFTPDIRMIKNNDPGLFTIVQMGGRGSEQMWRMGAFNDLYKLTEHAEVVTMLDTNLLHYLKTKGQPWEWSKVFLVPNGMHYDLFKHGRIPHDQFTVLLGKVGGVGKAGYDAARVAALIEKEGYGDKIRLIAPVQSQGYVASPYWMPVEPRPFYKMPRLYQSADVFLNVPEVEVLPNTIFEAFQTGLPVVVSKGSSIARLQTVPRERVMEMRADFGMPVEYFEEKWSPLYDAGEGEHYLQGEDPRDITRLIIHLYEHPDLRKQLGENAHEWTEKLDWTFQNKCGLLLKLARKAGLKA